MFLFLAEEKLPAQNAELGVVSSPAVSGVSARFSGKGGNVSDVRLCAEVCDVIRGKHSWPGIRADWHLLFNILSVKSFSGIREMGLNAGPGIAAGYVLDRNANRGPMAGLSGQASLDFLFNVPVTISLGMSAVCGFHISGEDGSGTTIMFYRNGICRAWIPALTIRYRF